MTDSITVNMPMKFKPWQVPNFASLDSPPRPHRPKHSTSPNHKDET